MLDFSISSVNMAILVSNLLLFFWFLFSEIVRSCFGLDFHFWLDS